MNLKLILFAISIIQFSVCNPISNGSSPCEYKNYANYSSSIVVDCHGFEFLPGACYNEDVNVSSVSAVSFRGCKIVEYADILNHFPNMSRLLFSNHNILPSGNFSIFKHLSVLKSVDSTINPKTTSAIQLSINTTNLEWFHFRGDHMSYDVSLQNAAKLEQVSLENMKLSSLPAGLLTNSTNLKIFSAQSNEIEAIDSIIWPNSVRYIDFSLNKIGQLKKSSFENLTNLQILMLKHNEINEIEAETFSQMNNLVYLNLDSNQINEINKTTLKGLNNLISASFGGNNIHHVEDNAFELSPKLLFLDLSRNNISSLNQHMFAGLNRLTDAHIYSNPIRELTAESFGNLTQLRTLNMLECKLETIDFNAFANMPKLADVYLSNNQISRLVKMAPTAWSTNEKINKTFRSDVIEYINNVDLEWATQIYNKTKEFYSEETFRRLPDELQYVKSFDERMGTGSNYGLKALHLFENQLTEIENNIFAEFKTLRKLSLSSNPISTLYPESFAGLNELEVLHLSLCKLTSVNFSMFTHLTKLKYLNLAHNQLTTIAAAPLPSVVKLDLGGNHLIDFPMQKSDLPNVKAIMIDINELNCSNLDNSFAKVCYDYYVSIAV